MSASYCAGSTASSSAATRFTEPEDDRIILGIMENSDSRIIMFWATRICELSCASMVELAACNTTTPTSVKTQLSEPSSSASGGVHHGLGRGGAGRGAEGVAGPEQWDVQHERGGVDEGGAALVVDADDPVLKTHPGTR